MDPTKSEHEEKYLTLTEAAEAFPYGIHRETIRRYMRQGVRSGETRGTITLRHIRVGDTPRARLLTKRSWIKEFLEQLEVAEAGQ